MVLIQCGPIRLVRLNSQRFHRQTNDYKKIWRQSLRIDWLQHEVLRTPGLSQPLEPCTSHVQTSNQKPKKGAIDDGTVGARPRYQVYIVNTFYTNGDADHTIVNANRHIEYTHHVFYVCNPWSFYFILFVGMAAKGQGRNYHFAAILNEPFTSAKKS